MSEDRARIGPGRRMRRSSAAGRRIISIAHSDLPAHTAARAPKAAAQIAPCCFGSTSYAISDVTHVTSPALRVRYLPFHRGVGCLVLIGGAGGRGCALLATLPGDWPTATSHEETMEFHAANRTAVSSTEARAFSVGGREIILCEIDGVICAVDGTCTHEDLPLEGGEIEDGIIECPWHGALYEACTGKVRALPATRPLEAFPVRVDEEGEIYVEIPDQG